MMDDFNINIFNKFVDIKDSEELYLPQGYFMILNKLNMFGNIVSTSILIGEDKSITIDKGKYLRSIIRLDSEIVMHKVISLNNKDHKFKFSELLVRIRCKVTEATALASKIMSNAFSNDFGAFQMMSLSIDNIMDSINKIGVSETDKNLKLIEGYIKNSVAIVASNYSLGALNVEVVKFD